MFLIPYFRSGNTFNIDISTILSVETLTPVVSKSKKQIGFDRFLNSFNLSINNMKLDR